MTRPPIVLLHGAGQTPMAWQGHRAAEAEPARS